MIKQQTLSFVRLEIISALHTDVRTAGQLDFDASAITNYGRRTRRTDEVTGQRIDSDPVRGSSSRTFKDKQLPFTSQRLLANQNLQSRHHAARSS